MLYDGLLLIALWFAVAALVLMLSGGRMAEPDRSEWLILALRGALLLSTYGFFAGFWMHGGQTLGMRAWRMKLVTRNGQPISLSQSACRFAAAALALAAFGLGYLWVLIDREKLAWHDRLSGTRLVLVPKAAGNRP